MADITQKFLLDDIEYDQDQLNSEGIATLKALDFAVIRLQELNNHTALLQRAKNSYVNSLKREMLSDKAGFLFSDD